MLNCASCDTSLHENQAYTCSRCAEPIYCSRTCQHDHWSRGHKYNCNVEPTTLYIGNSIEDKTIFDNDLDFNRKYIVDTLSKRGIDKIYLDVVNKYKVPFYFTTRSTRSTKINPIRVTDSGIRIYVKSKSKKDVFKSINVLVAPMTMAPLLMPASFSLTKYTKFTYYIKIYLTLVSLSKIKNSSKLTSYDRIHYNSNDYVGRVAAIKGIPNYDQCMKNLGILRDKAIELASNLSLDDFKDEVASVDKEVEGMDQIWLDQFKYFKNKTIKSTKFNEKFIGTIRRAYNSDYGVTITITLRSVIDPLNSLLDVDGLFLLLIHELGHTLAPSYGFDKRYKLKINGKTKTVVLPSQKSHAKRFQMSSIYLFRQAHKLGLIPFVRSTYYEYEMALRKAHQDSSLGIPINLSNL